MRSPLLRTAAFLFVLHLSAGLPAAAQDPRGPAAGEIDSLRAEIADLRAEIDALKRLVAGRLGTDDGGA